jgi:hypothetical protein
MKKAKVKMKKWLRGGRGVTLPFAFYLLPWLALFLVARVMAQDATHTEAEVKAAFLLNFTKYVDWPAEAFAATNSPIVVGVLGATSVSAELQKMMAARAVSGREIVFKQLAVGDEPGTCHILFIASAEQAHEPEFLAMTKDKDILTVGESDHFLDHGGIIDLTLRNQKIGMDINLAAANRTRLKISSRLMQVANVMKGKVN